MQADMKSKKYFKCFELFYKTGKNLPSEMWKQYYDALMEYGLYWVEPSDPVILSLLQWAMYSIDKFEEHRNKTSKSMEWNSNAVKTWEKHKKQIDTDTDRLLQMPSDGSKEVIEVKNNKKDLFELFRKEYPHARKWKKQESKNYFSKQNPQEVMQQVSILKWKLKAWLVEAQFIPACERWIRDFTPLSDDVVKQDLLKICKWHLTCGGDIKQRASELKQTFWEEQINEIVKAIQQKNKPLF